MRDILIVVAFIATGALFVIQGELSKINEREIKQLSKELASVNLHLTKLEADYLASKATMTGREARIKDVLVSMYSPERSQTDSTPFETASMKRVRGNYIAVSRDLFAQGWTFGKSVYIPQKGMLQIEDLMDVDKFQGGKDVPILNSIDLFSFDHDEAHSFTPYTTVAYLLD